MGTQSSARLKGDDYQHLLSWHFILSLKLSHYSVEKIKLEDTMAGLVDDVTIYRSGSSPSVDFFQIKFHVDKRESYSINSLITASSGKSIMEKFLDTWKSVKTLHPGKKITLNLYSNWLIDPTDNILKCISGEDARLTTEFYSANPKTDVGQKREEWKKAHKASDIEFEEFCKSLVFHLGAQSFDGLKEGISDRMASLGLKNDENSLVIAAGIVRTWIKSKTKEITVAELEQKINEHDLYLPVGTEKAVAVNFITVKDKKFDLEPEYVLDWRKYFVSMGGKGDHELIDPDGWNKTLMPELVGLEERVNKEKSPTLIRARGFARLSPWFAFGFIFSEVGGYKIEISQQGQLWRTDAQTTPDFDLHEEEIPGNNSGRYKTVAVGISITGSLKDDVNNYLKTSTQVDGTLFLTPKSGLGKEALKVGGDVVALTEKAKEKMRKFVKKHQAEKLLLFYFGPISGACFIGHQLNSVCNEIQIMENASGSYIPSFLLT
jgi:hypothetical protein